MFNITPSAGTTSCSNVSRTIVGSDLPWGNHASHPSFRVPSLDTRSMDLYKTSLAPSPDHVWLKLCLTSPASRASPLPRIVSCFSFVLVGPLQPRLGLLLSGHIFISHLGTACASPLDPHLRRESQSPSPNAEHSPLGALFLPHPPPQIFNSVSMWIY